MTQKNDNMYKDTFLTYMDYAATGEGRTVEINFCYADSEEEAKQKHLDRFYGSNKEAQDFFRVDVDVMRLESPEAKNLLKNVFKFGGGLHKDLLKAGIEFHLKFHFNYS